MVKRSKLDHYCIYALYHMECIRTVLEDEKRQARNEMRNNRIN